MKFKAAVIGILIAILGVNSFMAYTVIQEEKKQTRYLDTIAWAKIHEIDHTAIKDTGDWIRSIYYGDTE